MDRQRRVVALGEVTHGDGAAFLAKARLVRFLHQVMGFDVLAWKSGFFDVPLVDAALRSVVPLEEAASLGLYKIWSRSVEVQPTLAYVRSTQGGDRPIRSVGFDCRVATERSRSELFPASIFAFFDRLDPGRLLLALRGLPQDHWLKAPLSSGFYFYEPQTANLPRLYDAIFFLDEMTPSTALSPPDRP